MFDPTEEFARTVAVSTDDDFFSRQRKRQELMANHRRQEKVAPCGWGSCLWFLRSIFLEPDESCMILRNISL